MYLSSRQVTDYNRHCLVIFDYVMLKLRTNSFMKPNELHSVIISPSPLRHYVSFMVGWTAIPETPLLTPLISRLLRYAAVYLAAGMENLLEEMVLLSLPGDPHAMLTASALEHSIANSGDFWGLLQPYAHLNAGRTASGEDWGSRGREGRRSLGSSVPLNARRTAAVRTGTHVGGKGGDLWGPLYR